MVSGETLGWKQALVADEVDTRFGPHDLGDEVSLIGVEAITRRRSVGEVTPLLSLVVTTRHYRMFSILNNSWMTGSAALGEPLCDPSARLMT